MKKTIIIRLLLVSLISAIWVTSVCAIDPWEGMGGAKSESMMSDDRARSINDLFSIKIEHNASASTESDIETDTESSLEAKVDAWARLKGSLFDLKAIPVGVNSALPELGVNGKRDHKGGGKDDLTGKMTDILQARVVDIRPNGNLIFEARKQVTIGENVEVVIFSGEIRPGDLNENNEISSEKVADACIMYAGIEGPIKDAKKKGFLGKLLDFLWIF